MSIIHFNLHRSYPSQAKEVNVQRHNLKHDHSPLTPFIAMTNLPSNTHPHCWNDPGLRNLNSLLLTCYLGAIANGYINSLISNLIANPRWHTDISGLSQTSRLGLVTSAQSLGCIAAFFPAPWLSDTYGRRTGIIFGCIGMICGSVSQIFCKTFDQFLGARLVVGFASIFNTISSSALLVELAHPRQRGVAGALFNTCFFIGSITAAWTSYGAMRLDSSWSWKIPVAAQSAWVLGQLGLVVAVPESPRWLVRNGEEEVAREMLVKYHANGDEGNELVRFELAKMRASAEMEAQDGMSTGWSSLYTTPGNRKRLLLSVVIGVATQWVGNGIISFYLAPVLQTVGITDSFQQQGINGGLQIYNWCLACGAALLSEKAGRRRLFLTSAGTMLIFMIMVTICSALYSSTRSVAAGYAVIVFLFLFLGGYVIGLTPIPILYVNEIWPSHIRTKGTSVFWVSQAVAICFNQFVNPVALERIAWMYYLVYVAVLVFVIIFMFLYVPETKGLSLEEVSNIFDRERRNSIELTVVEANLHLRIAEERL
ncbi:general substrate transporter [Dendryphion nanum]|uniref:General substrate transporter n=1 Tax=Dendryphion nanum TaxID=256645 RepID=A0A9P9E2E3_9PLEO|nr:general substrate transporter [Dendryphion nanum]